MLAENFNHNNPWGMSSKAGHATYIPSALLLLMAIDNGWDIVKAQPVERWENYGPVYLITVRCNSGGEEHNLVIPRSSLVDKILEQHAPAMVPVC
jgi:hypothetical protein